MSKIVRERSLHVVTMYLSQDPWDRDKLFTSFHKMKLVFLDLHKELRSLGLADNEKALFDDVSKTINKTELIQIDIVERIQSGGDKTLHSDISAKDLPLEYQLLANFDLLIEITRNNAQQAREDAKQQYSESIRFTYIIAILILFILLMATKRVLLKVNRIESGLIDDAESMSWDATHDALTNVYNRRWLQHQFDVLYNDGEKRALNHSLLYIDLDEFKPVNDNYGHVMGDNFLIGITRELERCIRQNDTLARLGGDEFAILLENCDLEKAKEISKCLISRVHKFSLTIKGKKVSITGCSIGIKAFVGKSATFVELIKQTDAACYIAKHSGKNQFHIG
ncbi:MAG: GGDEF domain-containing protein [Gammaproteobacteria bacterium]|nr:GGDEF domain-containing protein [Gammaproteobacteria bacterium]